MATEQDIARIAASNPELARALHVISQIHGRCYAAEHAIATQDPRAWLRARLQIADLCDELLTIDETRVAA